MLERNNTVVEVCCGSALDAEVASRAGADRVELNSCIAFGGITPSYGAIERACCCGIPVAVMIRPRPEGFVYDKHEIDVMRRDIINAKRCGASAVVFGCLSYDSAGDVVIDETACRILLEAADGIETVFHRAFDMTPPHAWQFTLDKLIGLGFTRVLTSGHEKTAVLGINRLRDMARFSADRIEILPCGKIRADNAAMVLNETGCHGLHTSAFVIKRDRSSTLNPSICFSDGTALDYNSVTDGKIVSRFVKIVKEGECG